MKERERVLELVKKGVLSTEEALVLLERMATEKDEITINKEAVNVKSSAHVKEKNSEKTAEDSQKADPINKEEVSFEEEIEDAKEAAEKINQEKQEADQKRLEKILEQLANEANHASAELDEVNAEIKGIESDIKEKQEQIMVFNTMEELEALTEEKKSNREELEIEVRELLVQLEELRSEKRKLEADLKDIHKEQKDGTKASWSNKFEIPEDWKDTANETMSQVGEKMTEAGNQLGRLLKKTISSVSEAVNDNVDWKDVNFKVPGVASTKFSHEFLYPDTEATLIDIKVANGTVDFKTWDKPDLKVTADIKLYGKMEADSPFEAFLERSQIDVDDEKISFQIPNKRIRAELVFYLPERVYDHVAVKLLNGDVTVDKLEAKDVFMKSTNGELIFNDLNATMLEVEGVNGDIQVLSGEVLDLLVETVNGNVILKGNSANANISIVNGDIKITAGSSELKKVEAASVNGSIKLALPPAAGFDGTAKTSLGSINNRLADCEIIREKKEKMNQFLQFRRAAEDQNIHIKLSTTTGNILLKDNQLKDDQ